MTTAILMNPNSARTSKHGHALERAAANAPGVLFEQLDNFDLLSDQLKGLAKENIDLLIVSGGDGTVQAVVSALAEDKIFKKQPRLILLPHGTTNMTAADIGFHPNNPERLLEAVMRKGFIERATNVKSRTSVRIEGLVGMPPLHGYFFGCGAITRATLKCQTDVHGLGLKGHLATGTTLVYSIFKAIFSKDQSDPERINQPTELHVSTDGDPFGATQNLLFLATSLDKLILGSKPFWNQQGKGLHATIIGYPVTSILRNTKHIMFGGNTRPLDPTKYISRTASKITLKADTQIILDGELYDVGAEGLTISPGPELEFICGL